MDLVHVFNATAHWLDNPMHQMGVGLITPIVLSTIAMLVMKHHDKREAQAAKSSGPPPSQP